MASEKDLIKRGDVLELLYRLKEDKECPKNYGTLLTIISRIWDMPAVEPMKWISCIDRLPEPNKAVLVCTDTGEVDVDYYGEWSKDFIGLKGTEVIAVAWMPLPEPYKDGE